jgi:hypothetical protein
MQNGKPRVLKSQEFSYLTLTKQIFFTKDFLAFAVMNFLAGCHRVFLSNFFTIFGDQLISKEVVPPIVRSLFYGASSTTSKVRNNFIFLSFYFEFIAKILKRLIKHLVYKVLVLKLYTDN